MPLTISSSMVNVSLIYKHCSRSKLLARYISSAFLKQQEDGEFGCSKRILEPENNGIQSSYASVLKQCSSLSEGKLLHKRMLEDGCDGDTFLGNLLVGMYGNCGSFDEARASFDSISSRNVVSWNIMLSASAKNGHLQDARIMFDRMPERNVISWTTMLAAYAQIGHLQDAKTIFEQTPEPNLVSWNAMLAAYGQNKHGLDALRLFRFMNLEGVQPDKISFVSVLDACSGLTALSEGKLVHNIILNGGFETDVVVGTGLVNMYGKCGSLDDARSIFDRMPVRNVITWNAMVATYAQSGHLEGAKDTFELMPTRDVISWTGMIAAYNHNGHLDRAKNIFDRMPHRDVASWNSMMTAYAQNGYLYDARSMFEKVPQWNVVSWNGMIAAYTQNARAKDALSLFLIMDIEGYSHDRVTLISILDTCASLKVLAVSKLIHASIVDCGIELDVLLGTGAVNMYGKCGSLEDAKNVYDKMTQRDVVTWNSMVAAYAQNGLVGEARDTFDKMPERDLVSWVVIVTAHAQTGHMQEARNMFDCMPRRDVVSWNAMISAYAQNELLQEARATFDETPCKNLLSWNSMITAYAQYGHGKEALSIFSLMDLEGVMPDQVSFVGALDACTSCTALAEGKEIHSNVAHRGFHSDVAVGTALVNFYGKCRDLEDAEEAFGKIAEQNVVSYTAMLSAYAQNGHARDALKLFQAMDLQGVKPDKITFISIINACTSITSLADGKVVYASILDSEHTLDSSWGTCLIGMFGNCGSLADATKIFNAISRHSTSVILWTAMISAYAQNGHVNEALGFFQRMNLEGVQPDDITFTCTLSACAHAGALEDCLSYFKFMQDFELVPKSEQYGCMVDLLGRLGRLEEAEDLINNMPFEPDVLTWTSMMGASKLHNEMKLVSDAARYVFELDPENSAPYVTLSNMCARDGG